MVKYEPPWQSDGEKMKVVHMHAVMEYGGVEA